MNRQNVELGVAIALAVAAAATGVGILKAKHESRQFFAELEALKREQDRLQVDWGRLQLEQSTWATHPRIETLARESLALEEPTLSRTVIVAEPDQ